MKKGLLTLFGFILVGIGFLTLILSLIGIQLSFMTWMEKAGPLTALLLRLGLIMSGFIMIYLVRTNLQEQ